MQGQSSPCDGDPYSLRTVRLRKEVSSNEGVHSCDAGSWHRGETGIVQVGAIQADAERPGRQRPVHLHLHLQVGSAARGARPL